MKTKEEIKSRVEELVEANIEGVFEEAHAFAKTESGDITPEQAFWLDKLLEEITELVVAQVLQNLPRDKED